VTEGKRPWFELTLEEAVERRITFPNDEFWGPLTTNDEECPFPWDRMQHLRSGMYHCEYCGEMVIGGMSHVDYREAKS
jgi:hypothetical protein